MGPHGDQRGPKGRSETQNGGPGPPGDRPSSLLRPETSITLKNPRGPNVKAKPRHHLHHVRTTFGRIFLTYRPCRNLRAHLVWKSSLFLGPQHRKDSLSIPFPYQEKKVYTFSLPLPSLQRYQTNLTFAASPVIMGRRMGEAS